MEKKSPVGDFAHLGVMEEAVRGFFDLSTLSEDTKILELSTPLKDIEKFYDHI